MMFYMGLIIGVALGFVVGWLWLKSFSSSSSKDFVKLKTENDLTLKEKTRLLNENQSYQEKEKHFIQETSSLKTKNEELQKELTKQEQHFEDKLKDQKSHYEEKQEEKEKHFNQLAEKTKIEFERTAQKIFLENTKSYREESSKNLTQILHPFKENIEGFKKSIQSFETKEKSLDEAIKSFKDINTEMRDEALKLTQALEGGSQTLGQWGEFMLANILERSGLKKGTDFILQGKGMEIKSTDGDSARPDAIIHLPDNKHIVIDSKVSSLLHYRNYLSAKDEQEKDMLLKKIKKSVEKHIDDLSSKQYHLSTQLLTPDFTLMFMPHEGLFALVTQYKNLFDRAWSKKIVIVSPSTLLATLITVASIWKIERQNKNAEKIAKQSGSLYDKFVGFLTDMNAIEKGLEEAQKHYVRARSRLETGHGSLIKKAEKIKELGAKTSKSLPPNF